MKSHKELKEKWVKLLSNRRLGEDSYQNSNNTRSNYLIDVDRITYSSHFRKLQDKTQVHPLAKSDYVRTRLTHSLEVSGVGRSLGYNIGQYLVNKYELDCINEHDFGYIIQAACLAHDIGNPPFGHVGEDAIIAFITDNHDSLLKTMSQEEYNNLLHFDGNSQGFRIITNLAGWKYEGGLKLTYATLGTFCKYPRVYVDKDILDGKIGTAKVGVMSTEKDTLKNIANELGLIKLIDNEEVYYRHPLAFILEAADDICYCVADIEDAFFVSLSSLKEVETLLGPIARQPSKYSGEAKERVSDLRKEPFYKKLDARKKVEWLRGKAISNLIVETQRVFIENEEDILNGTFNSELLQTTVFRDEISECKKYARANIFTSHDKIHAEIIGIEAITGILEEFYKMILKPNHPKSKRINNLLETKIDVKLTTYENLINVIDFISDFTDRNIMDFYKILKGL